MSVSSERPSENAITHYDSRITRDALYVLAKERLGTYNCDRADFYLLYNLNFGKLTRRDLQKYRKRRGISSIVLGYDPTSKSYEYFYYFHQDPMMKKLESKQ